MARDQTGVRVEGLSRVLRDLKALGLEVSDLKEAFAKIADEGARVVAHFTPRKSGRLAADARGSRAQSKAVVIIGRSSVPYAGPINYGWPERGIAPALFTAKADQAMQPVAIAHLENEIETIIRRKGLNR